MVDDLYGDPAALRHQLTGIRFSRARPVLGTARVRENWFSVSPRMAPTLPKRGLRVNEAVFASFWRGGNYPGAEAVVYFLVG